jgi:hypothetical protein
MGIEELFIYLWLYTPCGPWPLFQFLNLYTFGGTPSTGDQPVARPLRTHRTIETQNKRAQTSMPRVGFEPTISAFKRAKTVHSLDRATTVIGIEDLISLIYIKYLSGDMRGLQGNLIRNYGWKENIEIHFGELGRIFVR